MKNNLSRLQIAFYVQNIKTNTEDKNRVILKEN